MREPDTTIHRSSVLSRFNCVEIQPVSPNSSGVEVLLDGVPYCRFSDYASAVEAEKLWRQHWPGLAAKKLTIVGLPRRLRAVASSEADRHERSSTYGLDSAFGKRSS